MVFSHFQRVSGGDERFNSEIVSEISPSRVRTSHFSGAWKQFTNIGTVTKEQ
jgi:hypothetical protein